LLRPLKRWLYDVFCISYNQYHEPSMRRVAIYNRIDVGDATGQNLFHMITAWCDTDDERLLDIVHTALQLAYPTAEQVDELEVFLMLGGSVWRATSMGLQRRVEATAKAAFETVIQPSDLASEELAEAWSKAYARNPDASDAWDHAIKAAEAVLIPIVVPAKDKANLGSVAGHLKVHPEQFSFGLESTGIGSVETLEAMIRLMWPNPDRHGDPAKSRVPTIKEARAVVQVAVTLVQWARDGQIVRR
jgi:hypothetical protein